MITTENVLPEQNINLPGPCMSRLLGISLIEYYNLNHGALKEVTDNDGHTAYTLEVDRQNDPALLNKLHTDEQSVLHFSAQQIHAVARF